MNVALRAYDDATVLALGARGARAGAPFVLAGRTCVRGQAGALWNEWTLRFDDGRHAFLAEAGGRFTAYEEGALFPGWDALVPGATFDVGYVVVERGVATRVARWGEAAEAPATYRYVDLSFRSGASATVDFGESARPQVFLGNHVSLEELGLTPHVPHPRLVPAPDVSRPRGVDVWLDVGDDGVLEGAPYRVLGMLSRTDMKVRWDEYLLHDARTGFRWLVLAEGRWSLAEPVEAGRVVESAAGATIGADSYEVLSEGTARVDWATGELPWQVAIGDSSMTKELVRVRDRGDDEEVLAKEWTPDMVSWSHARPLTTEAIAVAFGKRALPKPARPGAVR
jgi:hypothetical protein